MAGIAALVVTARWGGGGAAGALFQGRWLVVGDAGQRSGAGAGVPQDERQELSPLEDRGTILVNVTAPDGATLDYTNRYALELEKIGRDYPEFDRMFRQHRQPHGGAGSDLPHGGLGAARAQHLDMARELQPKVGALPG